MKKHEIFEKWVFKQALGNHAWKSSCLGHFEPGDSALVGAYKMKIFKNLSQRENKM